MKKIADVIRTGEYRKPTLKRHFLAYCSQDEFAEIFLKAAASNMYFEDESFFVDELNKEVFNQLYYYLIGSNSYDGDLRKGILLSGALGCGKTVAMNSFMTVFNEVSDKVMTMLSAKDISVAVAEKEYGYWHKRPLLIDDIGKEQTSVNTYGTISKPFEDLINHRYNTGVLTMGTTNLKFEDMPYSKHVIDRMKQMFNIIVLKGRSRRQ